MKKVIILTAAAAFAALPLLAQEPVTSGRGSYAAYPPPYKGATSEHPGFQATKMLTRKIYAEETDRNGNPRPIPTNDWWTDVLNNQFSGALWSYPAMLKTAEEGVTVAFPTHWNENGTEVKADTWLRVGGVKFTATEARAYDWHDADVEILLPSSDGKSSILATLTHGVPFTWFEFTATEPFITFSATPEIVESGKEGTLLRIGTDLYGVYHPSGASASMTDDGLRVEGASWLSVAPVNSAADFAKLLPYSGAIIRDSRISWEYAESTSTLTTRWKFTTTDLRGSGAAPVTIGFLPHVYKHDTAQVLPYNGMTYLTPRGTMKMATSSSGEFEYAYRFPGMLPYYPAPLTGDNEANPYDPAKMRALMSAYAAGGGFGGDTYWGGKGLTQMALNMTFAKETGDTELYELSKKRLREAFENWLTYTPGEDRMFFSYYPRWGGMLGFDVSYDSDAFNDHHFHYGYFIYAGALLCLEDESFRNGYGDLLRMIAKDYANYDREDTRFPFLRTLDPWAGHSYAGGLGDHGNDNGNGQESSSEAMQGWGGVYMLGVALGDKQLRDAGIFGWMTESRATVEYWFDRDHIKGTGEGNYDYTLYGSPYNTNITCKGIGWWTWFSGDPLWMHSIQWLPVSPCLNYLSEDLDFVRWDYDTMMAGTAYDWFEKRGDNAALAEQSVGNVVLSYLERTDPAEAARIFDEAWDRGCGIAKGVDTGHISYFVTHSHLTHGDPDFTVSADIPTATAYRKGDGTMSYTVYNPGTGPRTVRFYRDGALLRTVTAPAGMTVFTDEARAESILLKSEKGEIVAPGESTLLTATLLDQYGAPAEGEAPVLSCTAGASVNADGLLTIAATTAKGTNITVTAISGNIRASLTINVNDAPRTAASRIDGLPDFVETGVEVTPSLINTDQYGTETFEATEWSVTDPEGNVTLIPEASFSFSAAGHYTIASGNTSAPLLVLPPLGDVAHGCKVTVSSEENVGTKAAGAVDGDMNTRWGSKHTDSEWIMLDLGADHRIASVTIWWEVAYAADYDIETLPDGANPEDENAEWSVIYEQRGLTGAGKVRHSVAGEGRYVHVNCLRRGSNYGYSIIEMQVGGVRSDADPDAVAGIELTLPALAAEGESVATAAYGVTLAGNRLPLANVSWGADRPARFGSNSFTPLSYGVYTVTATSDGMSASREILVEESMKLTSMTANPTTLSLLTNEKAFVEIQGNDQFGGLFPLEPATVTLAVLNESGKDVNGESASFDLNTGEFIASVRGDYTIVLNGQELVSAEVRDVNEANLAARKPARASSSRDGNTPGKATDLNMQSRWESEWDDNQWIAVDLEGGYLLDRMVINWEGAYAKEYTVSVSLDGDNWTPVYSTTAGKGGREEFSFTPAPAMQLRVDCHKRALGYGNSIYELEAYGQRRLTDAETGIEGIYDDSEAEYFTLEGFRIHGTPAPGIYIRRVGLRADKVIIR